VRGKCPPRVDVNRLGNVGVDDCGRAFEAFDAAANGDDKLVPVGDDVNNDDIDNALDVDGRILSDLGVVDGRIMATGGVAGFSVSLTDSV
jgi:hypothetical protein